MVSSGNTRLRCEQTSWPRSIIKSEFQLSFCIDYCHKEGILSCYGRKVTLIRLWGQRDKHAGHRFCTYATCKMALLLKRCRNYSWMHSLRISGNVFMNNSYNVVTPVPSCMYWEIFYLAVASFCHWHCQNSYLRLLYGRKKQSLYSKNFRGELSVTV